MTEGKSSVLPMTNVLVHAREQCHSYTARGHQGPVPKGHLDWK
jgi:hypothetical protein